MAALAGGIIGTIFGGPIGGFIGGTIGTFLDRSFIFPALFGTGDFETTLTGPRLEGITVTLAREGAPLAFGLGPECPMTGILVWASEVDEVRIEETTTTEVEGGGKGGGGGDSTIEQTTVRYEYFQSLMLAFSDQRLGPASRLLKLYADGREVYSDNESLCKANNIVIDLDRVDEVRVYPGDQTVVDPALAADTRIGQPSGQLPSHEGTFIVVLDRWALHTSGNRIPQFRAIVEVDNGITREDAYGRLMERAGLDSADYDFSNVTGFCLRGFTSSGIKPTSESLQSLSTFFDSIIRVDADGKVEGFDRGREQVIDVPRNALSASDEVNVDIQQTGVIRTKKEAQFFESVEVEYFDPANIWEVARTRELSRLVEGDATRSINLPITMTEGDARAIALRALYRPRTEGEVVEMTLTPPQQFILAGDVLKVDTGFEILPVFVDNARLGDNGRLEITGAVYEDFPIFDESPTDPEDEPPPDLDLPPVLRNYVFELPALDSRTSSNPGVYVAVATATPDTPIDTVRIFGSSDNAEYTQLGSLRRAVVDATGTDNVRLAPVVGQNSGVPTPAGLFLDRSFDVELVDPSASLGNATRQEVLNGSKNLGVWIDRNGNTSIFGWTDAVDQGSGIWTIKNTIWGLFGSDAPPLDIKATDTFLFAAEGSLANHLGFAAFGIESINTTVYVKAVPQRERQSNLPASTITLTNRNSRPIEITRLKPELLPGGLNDDGVLFLSWEYIGKFPFIEGTEVAPGIAETFFKVEVGTTNNFPIPSLTQTVASNRATFDLAPLVSTNFDLGDDTLPRIQVRITPQDALRGEGQAFEVSFEKEQYRDLRGPVRVALEGS